MTRKERIDRALKKAEEEFEASPVTKLLRERIAYHEAKIAEERAAEEARAERRRRIKRLLSLGLLSAS
jgi:hypothetical protein